MQMFAELDKLISDRAGRPLCSLSVEAPCRNAVDLRKTVIKNYLRNHLVRLFPFLSKKIFLADVSAFLKRLGDIHAFKFKRKARCPLCKGFNGQVRNDGARCILIDFTVHGRKRKKVSNDLNLAKSFKFI